ncbi:hypothetical protein PF005_g6374 [Phytophthora fragariae]|nr:hypothetical protein PF003_g27860 [Phytophthora fragariae]KAE9223277.1 hypothetical protein PF005_g6374 [Phytophthora fragariae]KAE9250441.1 hypothetical protein PF002_g4797 [Phytophthora fragariae]KAE9323887.1 hypothetical protein PF001_g3719 [Phytophthora fragariae]
MFDGLVSIGITGGGNLDDDDCNDEDGEELMELDASEGDDCAGISGELTMASPPAQ